MCNMVNIRQNATDGCIFFVHANTPVWYHSYIYSTLPVPSGVVQRAASPHRLKVIDAPPHERNSCPEDGKNPDNAAHRQSRAPEELLPYRIKACVIREDI